MKRTLGRLLATTGVLCAGLGAGSAWAGNTYCCTDAQGRQVCADVLPEACYGKAYREINARGVTVRRVDAPISADQRAKRDEDVKRRAEEEVALRDQRRRDTALLNTYSNESEIELSRDRRVAEVEDAIRRLREQESEMRKRRAALDKEVAAFGPRALPSDLQASMAASDRELRVMASQIESRQRDIADIRVRFEDDRKRFRELRRQL